MGQGTFCIYMYKKKLQSKIWALSQLVMYNFIHYMHTINTSQLHCRKILLVTKMPHFIQCLLPLVCDRSAEMSLDLWCPC